ncbi:MAG: DinB family protein [Ferruginibacter sp.]
MPRPVPGTYPSYFETYISLIKENDVSEAIRAQDAFINDYFLSIPQNKHEYAYAPGKWTLKELLQHIIDTERIFQYRALCFARGEKQSLPGFEEDDYAAASNANARNWQDLCSELKSVRKSSLVLYESFTDAMLGQAGVANNKSFSCNAIGFCIAGHLQHHKNIIEERYL